MNLNFFSVKKKLFESFDHKKFKKFFLTLSFKVKIEKNNREKLI